MCSIATYDISCSVYPLFDKECLMTFKKFCIDFCSRRFFMPCGSVTSRRYEPAANIHSSGVFSFLQQGRGRLPRNYKCTILTLSLLRNSNLLSIWWNLRMKYCHFFWCYSPCFAPFRVVCDTTFMVFSDVNRVSSNVMSHFSDVNFIFPDVKR